MTIVALMTKGDLRLRARIADISRRDCWQYPMFLPQFLSKTYILVTMVARTYS
jgi:hypothetical protein